MATKSTRHVHKYYQAELPSGKVWACALPTCNHHMPPHYAKLMMGKASICWKCGETFVLESINMKRDKPICDECSGLAIQDPVSEVTYLAPPETSEDILLCTRCGKNPRAGALEICAPCFLIS